MPCEDYPCCGHEPGGCPVVDENGVQRFHCARCGVLMEHQARSAVCQPCHRRFLTFNDDDAHPCFDDEPSDDDSRWDLGKEEIF
jgi:hypothetical protein